MRGAIRGPRAGAAMHRPSVRAKRSSRRTEVAVEDAFEGSRMASDGSEREIQRRRAGIVRRLMSAPA